MHVIFLKGEKPVDHWEKEARRTIWISTEEHFIIHCFTLCTSLRQWYTKQWSKINNAEYLCHKGNQITIEIQHKVTREKITANSSREKNWSDPECTWEIDKTESRGEKSVDIWEKETEGIAKEKNEIK